MNLEQREDTDELEELTEEEGHHPQIPALALRMRKVEKIDVVEMIIPLAEGEIEMMTMAGTGETVMNTVALDGEAKKTGAAVVTAETTGTTVATGEIAMDATDAEIMATTMMIVTTDVAAENQETTRITGRGGDRILVTARR